MAEFRTPSQADTPAQTPEHIEGHHTYPVATRVVDDGALHPNAGMVVQLVEVLGRMPLEVMTQGNDRLPPTAAIEFAS